ncbi:hypothetical protein [Nitrosomonas communis]|uniref:hypothetical protein n=1 Tax=Nitrosomonas communis TaxID=44574 RepID=UPI003D2B8AFD
MSEAFYNIETWYDEKRCMWFFRGIRFDFAMHWTDDPEGNIALECDCVTWEGDPREVHIAIDIGYTKITKDEFQTAVLKELSKHWILC